MYLLEIASLQEANKIKMKDIAIDCNDLHFGNKQKLFGMAVKK